MIRLELGDCRDVMAAMVARGEQVDAIVCDPPYELGFMGKSWDRAGVAADPAVWRLALDVLRPGGMLLAFGGSRTYHRLTCAVEDAGFEIRDCLLWVYSQGFPKSKALLKPAYEPVVMARKPGPLRRLDIDGCRIPTDDNRDRPRGTFPHSDDAWGNGRLTHTRGHDGGRFPANVVHDGSDEVLAAFAAFGAKTSGGGDRRSNRRAVYGVYDGDEAPRVFPSSSGCASRFFYCAKASKRERDGSKHPTIKPQALMRWLVRLVVPVGGTLLDPFAGSGSTLIAARAEGFDAVGVEQDADNYADALRRCGLLVPDLVEAAE
jgi:DNA modification methylase